MTRIKHCFDQLQKSNKKAFIAYLMAGDPNYQTSLDILCQLPQRGVDIIEIGFPFTDPIADGPTIQRAAERALEGGQTLARTLDMVKIVRGVHPHTPIVLMGYANPIFHFGIPEFLIQANNVGIDGLIVVDLPPEEDHVLLHDPNAQKLDLIRLVTPTTTSDRFHKIKQNTSGFIYYVSITGVTGTATATVGDIAPHINQIKTAADLPVVVGFGIKDIGSIRAMAPLADGVVVGSAIVERLAQGQSQQDVLQFITDLARALDAV